jgi:hypothetical protein
MGILTKTMRDAVPTSEFGLPGERKYPMPDAGHAANAKARATQQENRGNITPSQKAQIDAKANAVLGRGSHPNSHRNLGKYLHPKKGA